MADKLIMWTHVLLTISTLGLFVFLVRWTREHRLAPPWKYNTAIIVASICALVGFVFLGVVLIFAEQRVIPACLFSDLSCSAPIDSETGVLPAVVILLGFAVFVVMLKPGLEKRCPVCKRFGALELLRTREISAYEYETEVWQDNRSRGMKVTRRMYDYLFVCTVCNSRTHKEVVK